MPPLPPLNLARRRLYAKHPRWLIRRATFLNREKLATLSSGTPRGEIGDVGGRACRYIQSQGVYISGKGFAPNRISAAESLSRCVFVRVRNNVTIPVCRHGGLSSTRNPLQEMQIYHPSRRRAPSYNTGILPLPSVSNRAELAARRHTSCADRMREDYLDHSRNCV